MLKRGTKFLVDSGKVPTEDIAGYYEDFNHFENLLLYNSRLKRKDVQIAINSRCYVTAPSLAHLSHVVDNQVPQGTTATPL